MNLEVELNFNGFNLFDNAEFVAEEVIMLALEETDFVDDVIVSLSVVDEKTVKDLNKNYRGINSVTDVLSFVQYDENYDFEVCEGEAVFLGDIVICYNKLVEQAKEYGHGIKREFAYLICHSVLHLLAYDHIDEEDKAEMRAMEEKILNKLGYIRLS